MFQQFVFSIVCLLNLKIDFSNKELKFFESLIGAENDNCWFDTFRVFLNQDCFLFTFTEKQNIALKLLKCYLNKHNIKVNAITIEDIKTHISWFGLYNDIFLSLDSICLINKMSLIKKFNKELRKENQKENEIRRNFVINKHQQLENIEQKLRETLQKYETKFIKAEKDFNVLCCNLEKIIQKSRNIIKKVSSINDFIELQKTNLENITLSNERNQKLLKEKLIYFKINLETLLVRIEDNNRIFFNLMEKQNQGIEHTNLHLVSLNETIRQNQTNNEEKMSKINKSLLYLQSTFTFEILKNRKLISEVKDELTKNFFMNIWKFNHAFVLLLVLSLNFSFRNLITTILLIVIFIKIHSATPSFSKRVYLVSKLYVSSNDQTLKKLAILLAQVVIVFNNWFT